MNFRFQTQVPESAQAIFIPVFEGGKIGPAAKEVSEDIYKANGMSLNYLIQQKEFKGAKGQTCLLASELNKGEKPVVLVGVGAPDQLKSNDLGMLTSAVQRASQFIGVKDVAFVADTVDGVEMSREEFGARMADTLGTQLYAFDRYKKTKAPKLKDHGFSSIVEKPLEATFLHSKYRHLTESVNWTKNLCNEPPNALTPEVYANHIKDELGHLPGVSVKIIDEKEMEELGMGGALIVGKGSANPPRIVVMEYEGPNSTQEKPFGLVGKGVTMDTGGYSLKPSPSQVGMHMDMAGSAAVAGTIRSLAYRQAPVKAVAVVGLVENMISGHAYKTMDIIGAGEDPTMMNGSTVEVTNTDAEGRLVLADCLTYIQQECKVDRVANFATLTGAMPVALGNKLTGVFSNDDELANALVASGEKADEPGWRMPYARPEFAVGLQSKRADMVNSGPGAGASVAANFLSRFIEDGTKWAHLDIAGTSNDGGMATGIGVRWMDQLFRDEYESKQPVLQPENQPSLAA